MLATINLSIGTTSEMSSKGSFVQSMQTQQPSTNWNPQLISKRVTLWMNTLMVPRPYHGSWLLRSEDHSGEIPLRTRHSNSECYSNHAFWTSLQHGSNVLVHCSPLTQNRATNEAFRSSYQTPSVAPTPSCPATFNTIRFQVPEWSMNHQHAPTPRNPVLMDIDASWKIQPLPFSCHQCGKAGHKAFNCPT